MEVWVGLLDREGKEIDQPRIPVYAIPRAYWPVGVVPVPTEAVNVPITRSAVIRGAGVWVERTGGDYLYSINTDRPGDIPVLPEDAIEVRFDRHG